MSWEILQYMHQLTIESQKFEIWVKISDIILADNIFITILTYKSNVVP